MNKVKIFHVFAFLLMSFGYLWTAYIVYSWKTYVKYVSMQGYFLVWFLYAFYASFIFTRKNTSQSIFGHKLYQLCFCMQILITIVFWAIVYPSMFDNPKLTSQHFRYNQYIHTIPILCLLVDFYLETPQFKKQDIVIITQFAKIALIVNFLFTVFDKPVYPFLVYTNLFTYVVIIGAYFLLIIGHKLALIVNERRKLNSTGKTESTSITETSSNKK